MTTIVVELLAMAGNSVIITGNSVIIADNQLLYKVYSIQYTVYSIQYTVYGYSTPHLSPYPSIHIYLSLLPPSCPLSPSCSTPPRSNSTPQPITSISLHVNHALGLPSPQNPLILARIRVPWRKTLGTSRYPLAPLPTFFLPSALLVSFYPSIADNHFPFSSNYIPTEPRD